MVEKDSNRSTETSILVNPLVNPVPMSDSKNEIPDDTTTARHTKKMQISLPVVAQKLKRVPGSYFVVLVFILFVNLTTFCQLLKQIVVIETFVFDLCFRLPSHTSCRLFVRHRSVDGSRSSRHMVPP